MRSALRHESDVKSCVRHLILVFAIVTWPVSGTCAGAPAAPQSVTPDKETTAEGIGLQAASVFTSILYLPFKSMLAVAGGLAGGIAYAFSLGDMEVAEAVWGPSVYGTYLIVPEHFTGEKPVEFFGTVPSAKR
jgi:hypothetical protein